MNEAKFIEQIRDRIGKTKKLGTRVSVRAVRDPKTNEGYAH